MQRERWPLPRTNWLDWIEESTGLPAKTYASLEKSFDAPGEVVDIEMIALVDLDNGLARV